MKGKKKLVGILTAMVMALCTVMPTSIVWADTATTPAATPEYIAGSKLGIVYAKGTAITIKQSESESAKNVITWGDGNTMDVPQNVVVFGGGAAGTNYASGSITMNSGTVNDIYGGGYANGNSAVSSANVGDAKINITGGTVANLVAGGGLSCSTVNKATITLGACNVYNIMGGAMESNSGSADVYSDPTATKAVVKEANIAIEGTTLGKDIFGGGAGYSYTGKTTLNIKDLELTTDNTSCIVAGGSNGRTDEGNIVIDGTKGTSKIKAVQTINRGTMGTATVKVNSGSIQSLFAGGEDPETIEGDIVNGNFDEGGVVTAEIGSGASVEHAYIGSGLSKAAVSLTGNYQWDGSRPVSNKIDKTGTWTVEEDSALTVNVTEGETASKETLLKEVYNEGTIINNGNLNIKAGSKLVNKGTIKGSGTITNAGTLDNSAAEGNLEYDNKVEGTVTGDSLLKIGPKYYKDFTAAHTALEANDTLTVIRDINIASAPWNFNAAKKAILDLNGHELN